MRNADIRPAFSSRSNGMGDREHAVRRDSKPQRDTRLRFFGTQIPAPLELTVKGPKYRWRRAPVLVKCEVCGYEWYRGDPDSSANHRREHARRLKYLDPKPNPRFRDVEHEQQTGLVHVTTSSSRWVHAEIYLRAAAFRREFQYDFVQWGGPEGDTDPNVRGYLFIDSANVAVGACAFRWRGDEDGSFWGLQWVWIAPKYRRSGVLNKHWNTLRQLHGDFYVEPPVSDAMIAFLKRNGDQRLLQVRGGSATEKA